MFTLFSHLNHMDGLCSINLGPALMVIFGFIPSLLESWVAPLVDGNDESIHSVCSLRYELVLDAFSYVGLGT